MKLPKKGLLLAAAATAMGLGGCAEPSADLAAEGMEEVNRVRCWNNDGSLNFSDLTRSDIYDNDYGFRYTDENDLKQVTGPAMSCRYDQVLVSAGADLDDPNVEILKENSGNIRPSVKKAEAGTSL